MLGVGQGTVSRYLDGVYAGRINPPPRPKGWAGGSRTAARNRHTDLGPLRGVADLENEARSANARNQHMNVLGDRRVDGHLERNENRGEQSSPEETFARHRTEVRGNRSNRRDDGLIGDTTARGHPGRWLSRWNAPHVRGWLPMARSLSAGWRRQADPLARPLAHIAWVCAPRRRQHQPLAGGSGSSSNPSRSSIAPMRRASLEIWSRSSELRAGATSSIADTLCSKCVKARLKLSSHEPTAGTAGLSIRVSL